MRQAANGDVTKAEAKAFLASAMKAQRIDKKSTLVQKIHHDAQAFAQLFTQKPFNPASLAVVQDCATAAISAPLIPKSAITTTTAPSSTAVATVTALVEQSLSLPANEITVQLDNDEDTWAYWTVNDPNSGAAAGFAELIGGTWQIYAGPGSADVGCAPGPTVPPQVLTYFGQSCSSTANTGNTGGSNDTGSTGTSTGPTSQQLQQAYQAGFSRGEHLEFPSSFSAAASANAATEECRTSSYPSADLNAQFDDGCVAGFDSEG